MNKWGLIIIDKLKSLGVGLLVVGGTLTAVLLIIIEFTAKQILVGLAVSACVLVCYSVGNSVRGRGDNDEQG